MQALRKEVISFKGSFNGGQGIIVEIPPEAFLLVLSRQHAVRTSCEVKGLSDTLSAGFDELDCLIHALLGEKGCCLEGKSKIYHGGGNSGYKASGNC